MDNREIDQKIQTLLFPWDESRCRICGWPLDADVPEQCHLGNCSLRPAPKKRADAPASYSGSLDLAMGVYEEFRKTRSWFLKLEHFSCDAPYWVATLAAVGRKAYGIAETSALAICKAILMASEAAGLSDASGEQAASTAVKKEASNA